MAHYLVKARPIERKLDELRAMLDGGAVREFEPFGRALAFSLENARRDPRGFAVWEEIDYCRPPLAAERAAVLDAHFTDLAVESVDEGAGWKRIESLPSLWSA